MQHLCTPSTSITESTLTTLLHGLLPPAASAAARRIRHTDEALLTTEERLTLSALAPASAAARRIRYTDEALLTTEERLTLSALAPASAAHGAGRQLARRLCAELGFPTTAIPRHPSGMPLWPPGVVGAIAHDEEFSVAVAAPGERYTGIGVDIEPPGHVEESLLALIAAPAERRMLRALGCPAKALFCIKESVFKAVYPRDRIFLEFSGIRVDLHQGTAATHYGRQVRFRVVTHPHVLALAWADR